MAADSKQPPHHIAAVTPREMLAVGGPVYDPPYETPLEDELAWHLVKYLKRQSGLLSQVSITTPGAVFWVDFVLEHQGRRIAIECGPLEGAEDDAPARLRAALLMGSGAFDVLYTIPGPTLFHHMEDVLFLVAHSHPAFFTERSQINLERLASSAVRQSVPSLQGPDLTVSYPPAAPVVPAMHLRRLDHTRPTDWLHDYDVALAHYGVPTLAQSA